ncbi:MAG: ABC transporter permease [Hyphomicrobiales bacterium]|nr:MAG: ABC transporter permease [Hyphomicrobiales bacterium]
MTALAPRPSALASLLPGFRLRIGVAAALVLLLLSFASTVWTPYPVDHVDTLAMMQGPSDAHLLGTDATGRDLLAIVMKGVLTSFVVAAIATSIGLMIGVPLGVGAATGGVWAERILLGGSGFLLSLSALGLAVILTALIGASALNGMLAIGLFNVAVFARATHGALVHYRGRDDIAASRLAGLNRWELARQHVLPGFMPVLAATAIAQLATGVLLEAALSYVGVAAQPPGTSLGLMLREAQGVLQLAPHLALVPGVALLLVSLALTLIATGIRLHFREVRDAA